MFTSLKLFTVAIFLFVTSFLVNFTSSSVHADSEPGFSDEHYVYGGFPETEEVGRTLTVLKNQSFVVGYDEEKKNPAWVAYRVFYVEEPEKHKRVKRFSVDYRTTAQVHSSDFTNSSFSRGHLAPSYAIFICYGSQAQRETYLMSNISPQIQSFNGGIWEKLERKIIRNYARVHGEVWEITGPVFTENDEKINDDIHVPNAFYKILVRIENNKPKVLSVLIPQFDYESEEHDDYLVSVNDIEEQTRLNIFPALDEELQEIIEAEPAESMW